MSLRKHPEKNILNLGQTDPPTFFSPMSRGFLQGRGGGLSAGEGEGQPGCFDAHRGPFSRNWVFDRML